MTFGHSDSDNLIRDNDIRRSREAGIHFRGGNKAFAPHRNRIEGNRIVDSGGEKGIGIDINGETEAVVLSKNEIRETRGRASRIGILIGAKRQQYSHRRQPDRRRGHSGIRFAQGVNARRTFYDSVHPARGSAME